MRIGELSKIIGIDIETIRFYEKEGILPSPHRESNGYRSYHPGHVERLAFIRHCRSLDMPLQTIKRLSDFIVQPDVECGGIDVLIEDQLRRVRARLESMKALEQQLAVLRAKCDMQHTAHTCGILQELVAAAHGEECACHPNTHDV